MAVVEAVTMMGMGVGNDYGETLDYNQRTIFLQELQMLAEDHSITVYFLGSPLFHTIPPFLPRFSAIPEPAPPLVTLYHGCGVFVEMRVLSELLNSFIPTGPVIKLSELTPRKPSYHCTRPALYYSNSLGYARVWSYLKAGLATYREIKVWGPEYSIMAISDVSGDVLNGLYENVRCSRIPQGDAEVARNASSSNLGSLILDQFANRNLSQKRTNELKPIRKEDPSTAEADVITGPLPSFEQNHRLS